LGNFHQGILEILIDKKNYLNNNKVFDKEEMRKGEDAG
jgi:hypothetical protein